VPVNEPALVGIPFGTKLQINYSKIRNLNIAQGNKVGMHVLSQPDLFKSIHGGERFMTILFKSM